MRLEASLLALALLVGGCSASPSNVGQPSASTSPTAAATPSVPCPNPEGGACLGDLDTGTFTTQVFEPALTYSVPDGWSNFEDLPGNFLLVPPGGELPGVDANTSDFIGVYTSVYAQNRSCATESEAVTPQYGVDATPEAIANEFAERPGLVTDGPSPAEVGGLTGFVLDVRVDPTWTGTCFYWPTPVVQLVGGRPPSALDHSIVAGNAARLYLLEYGVGTLLIEIVDVGDRGSLDALDKVAQSFQFDV